MMMDNEEALEWSQAWKGNGGQQVIEPAALRVQVERRTRKFRLWLAVEIIIGAAGLVVLPIFAWRSGDVGDVAMATVFSFLCAICLLRTFWTARQHWSPATESSRGFVELMLQRGSTMRRQIRFGWGVLALEVAVFVPWIAYTLERRHGGDIPLGAVLRSGGWLVLLVSLAVLFLMLLQRHNDRERAGWQEVRRTLADEE